MYIKIDGGKKDFLYMEMPESPVISITFDDDEGYWIACLILPTQVLVLKAGTHTECLDVVNKLLTKLNIVPETL